jgi:Uma2 family endonuclease
MAIAHDEIRLLSADDVLAMVEAGVLGDDERVELLDGVLLRVSPQGERHAKALRLLNRALMNAYPDAAVFCQITMRFADSRQLVDPDLAVVLDADYQHGIARAADASLAIEVAMTSQRRDRAKLAVYAAGGVQEAWLVDLKRNRIDVHRAPSGAAYTEHHTYGRDDELALPATNATIAGALCLP